MTETIIETQTDVAAGSFPMKLWLYTNYHCNLRCTYCVAESNPKALRRAFELSIVQKIVDEAVALGFQNIYFTGGEPFLLDDIYEMLAYTSNRVLTTVLTNGMLFRGKRLKRLVGIQNDNLVIQISLDGSRPEHHDPYRGSGSWQKTIDGIRTVQQHNFRVRISTTETPANTGYLDEICEYCRSLGINDEDHFIRPLAKRGFSNEGMEVSKRNLIPELTINVDGIYWHPLSTDPDLLVSPEIFPLIEGVSRAKTEYHEIVSANASEMQEFQ
jgi:MoaA/NifB/PqqE/SkfB family radical SAM enzyme